MTPKIHFITGNPNKLKEARQILNLPITSTPLDLPEIQSLNVEDVLEDKARRAYEQVNEPVIVEDVGFHIHALKNFPGALIKWVMNTVHNVGIVQMLEPHQDKSVTVIAGIGYFDGKNFHSFLGETKGTITSPRGESDFGFDPIVIPDGHEKTFAEMSSEEKNSLSHRAIAFRKLHDFLISS